MDEQTVYTELFKAGIKFVADIKERYTFFDLAKSLGLKNQKGKIFDYYEYNCGIQNNSLVGT